MSEAIDKEVDVIEQHTRRQGMRWTNQRRLIAKVALSHHVHFSAEELLELCRSEDRAISRATVYRTLAMMEAAGFVEGLDLGAGGKRYEHVLGHAHHDHMVCTACSKILEFVDPALEARQEAVAAQHGFVIKSHSHKIYGLCAECAAAAPAAGADSE